MIRYEERKGRRSLVLVNIRFARKAFGYVHEENVCALLVARSLGESFDMTARRRNGAIG